MTRRNPMRAALLSLLLALPPLGAACAPVSAVAPGTTPAAVSAGRPPSASSLVSAALLARAAGGREPAARVAGLPQVAPRDALLAPGASLVANATGARHRAAASAPGAAQDAGAEPSDEPSFQGRAPRVFGAEPVVRAIRIEGNDRVDGEAIRVHIRTRPGEEYDPARADADLRAIYAMGFFSDVTVELEDGPGPREATLVFRVQERPYIASVVVEGNDALEKEDLESALRVRARTIYEPEKVRKGVAEARKLYEEKGYLDVSIRPELVPAVGSNEVDLVYHIEEGEKIRIKDIVFEGNQHFSARKLRGVMVTSEKGLLSFITGSGTLNREALKTDVERLTAFYYDDGYVNVKVDEPRVERKGDSLEVTIKIDEGEPFQFGEIKLAGDVPPEGPEQEKLIEKIESQKGQTFRASLLREDVSSLTDLFGDQGYAFANVEPETLIRPEERTVDVTFRVSSGKPVSIGQIQITGNTKTRDKVIRRELKVAEQEPFNATQLRKSRDALQRLGFFSDVNVTTRKSAVEDQINLLVDVKEGSTGAFSAGAGYSSGDQFLFNVRVSENNLFGRGQRLVANADFGSVRRNIYLAFTEPYLLDTEVLGQSTLFNTSLDYGDFTRSATGFSLRALYPFEALGLGSLGWLSLEDTRFGLEYRLEKARIAEISLYAPPAVYAEAGSTVLSVVGPNLVRNTLNHAYDPTAGSFQDIALQYGGLGGDQDFLLLTARGRWYVPIYRIRDFGSFVYSIGGQIAWGKGQSGQSGRELPLVERFFPGGINTVRGYETRTLGPRQDVFDPQGNVINNKPIGGTNEMVLQNEIIFPIFQQAGIRGVVFFDMGNAFLQRDGIDVGDLRYSAGAGIRWLSPFGPLRIEYGYPLNIKDHEKKSAVLFSFGAPL